MANTENTRAKIAISKAKKTCPRAKTTLAKIKSTSSSTSATSTDASTDATTTLTPCANCTKNHVQINAALRSGGKVHLSAGTYTISSSIILQTGTTLEGEEGTKIVLADNVKWDRYRPIIYGANIRNARIVNIEVDGNRDQNTYPPGRQTWGRGYYRMLYFYKCTNVEIDHSYFHDNWADTLWSEKTQNLNFHDNVVRNNGHDAVSAYHSSAIYVTNNCLKSYGNDGVRIWGSSTPVYIVNNGIGVENGSPVNYAGILVDRGSIAYNCSNTISGFDPATKTLNGGVLNTGGCPISPAVAISSQSCNVADIGTPSLTNDYGGGASASTSTGSGSSTSSTTSSTSSSSTTADTSSSSSSTTSDTSTDTNTSDETSAVQINGHMVGAFSATGDSSMSVLQSLGGNTVLNYVRIDLGLDYSHQRITSWVNSGKARGIKLIDDVPDQLTQVWKNDSNTSKLLSQLTTHLKWLQANPQILQHIAGFWMNDDWYSRFGEAKPLLQQMTALIHQYAPNKPAICGFTGNTGYGGSVSDYAKFSANYSPSGCDMVGVYLYPWGNGNVPMTNLVNIIGGLKRNGWDPNVRPLVGMPQSYGAKYGYSVPTAAQVQQQTKYFCQQGAKHIIYFDFSNGTNATSNAGIRSGIKAGIEDCKAIWGN